MEDRQTDRPQTGAPSEGVPGSVRKPYHSPELVEWGTILDLTQGTKSSFQDFPKTGGSKGV
jgi:hypothetical protein